MEKNLNEREIKVVVTRIDYENSDKEFCFYGQDVSFYADVFDVKTNKKLFSNLYLSEKICGIDCCDFDVANYLYDDDEILEFLFWMKPEEIEDLHKLETGEYVYDNYLEPEDRYKQKWSSNKLDKLYFDDQWMSDYLAEYYDNTFFENDYFEDYTLGEFLDYLNEGESIYSLPQNLINALDPELTKNDIIEIFGNEKIWIYMYEYDFWSDYEGWNIDSEKFEKAPEILTVGYEVMGEDYMLQKIYSFYDLLVNKYFGNKIRVNKYWYSNFEMGCGYACGEEIRVKIKDLDKVFGENFEKRYTA